MTENDKKALQLEFDKLVAANLKKDGKPRKNADPLALARIDEIREIAKWENQRMREAARIARRERENSWLKSLGFTRGQHVFVLSPITGEREYGFIACAELPYRGIGGSVGVSFSGSYPYMFQPENVYEL